jgi:predicted  nucleic acid-binding Zn-ribbon protein
LVRARNNGAGAARLVGVTCQGCHLTVPATEAERIKRAPAGSVAHCDNCGAILVP